MGWRQSVVPESVVVGVGVGVDAVDDVGSV
jgi:hypothetical protein